MQLKVQEFLRRHGSDFRTGKALLERDFAIKAKQHGRFPNLWLLKYDQIESPFAEELVQECRGLILDVEDNYRAVAHPYHKFFNHGEALAAPIDWETAIAYEKLDGSLITMYHYAGEWHIATSGTPDADTRINESGTTFRTLFWETFETQGLVLEDFDPEDTYMFELVGPLNRVVVPYDKPHLFLHGARHLATGQEYTPSPSLCDAPKFWDLGSVGACQAAAEALDPLEQEGYVVVDQYFNRLKIKSPRYVAIHHARDTLSPRRIADLIRMGQGSEFLAYFPQLQGVYDDLKVKYDVVVAGTTRAYEEFKHIPDQKEFALAVKHLPGSGALFNLRAKKVASVQEWIQSLTEPAYHRLLGIKEAA
jgi:hypothetical protein